LFVHVSQIGFLVPEPGQLLSFDVGENPRSQKPEAKNVAIMSDAA
jgi:cold shock CspA family protein